MAKSSNGPGRNLPAYGSDGQVPVINTTQHQDTAWNDNGATNVHHITTTTNTASFGQTYLADTTANVVALALPAVDGSANHAPIHVKRQTGSSNAFTVTGTINGSTNLAVTTAVTLVTDGAAWFTV